METEELTQQRVSTALVSAVRTARGCEAKDAKATPELLKQLKDLASHLEQSARSDAAPVCALATKMAEQLVTKSDAKPENLLPWIQQILDYLCATLGVKADGETKKLRELTMDLASSSLAAARHRKSLEEGTRFGEMLVRMAFLKPEDVQRALNMQRARNCMLGEAMVELGFLSQRGLDAALHMQKQKRKPDAWVVGGEPGQTGASPDASEKKS